jgi:hypothetical protein
MELIGRFGQIPLQVLIMELPGMDLNGSRLHQAALQILQRVPMESLGQLSRFFQEVITLGWQRVAHSLLLVYKEVEQGA